MSSNETLLSDVVQIKRQFQKSVRLEDDVANANALDGYVPLFENIKIVDSIFSDILMDRSGAFTLTGPYGSGKSTLLLIINALVDKTNILRNKACEIFKSTISEEKLAVINDKFASRKWKVINITAKSSSLRDELNKVFKNTKSGVDIADVIQKKLEKNNIFLVADEFGKFLEIAIEQEDIMLMQTLAEIASRSKGKFIFIGVLHQSFSGYLNNQASKVREEFSKVQGRFQNYNIISNAYSNLKLLESSLETEVTVNKKDYTNLIKATITQKQDDVEHLNLLFNNLYPLHPLSALMISALAKKPYGQNERSVFSFLVSNELYGFNSFLKEHVVGDYYKLNEFFDFVKSNFDYTIALSNDSHKWFTINQFLNNIETQYDDVTVALYKSICAIDIFGSIFGISATKDVLRSCFIELSESDFTVKLSALEESRAVIHRKFNNSYSVFDGSDFVLDTELDRELTNTVVDYSVFDQFINLGQFYTAKEHYFRTGALRWMSLKIVPEDKLFETVKNLKVDNEQIGYYVVAIEGTDNSKAIEKLEGLENKSDSIAYGIAKNSYYLNEQVRTLVALRKLRENGEVQGDRIARREIDVRTATVEKELSNFLGKALYDTVLHSKDEQFTLKNYVEACAHASKVADTVYSDCIELNNELINKNKISASISYARKVLLNSMVSDMSKQNLGYEGTPPEFCIYLSVLSDTNLHVAVDGDTYGFVAYDNEHIDFKVKKLFKATREFILSRTGRNATSIKDIYDLWAQRPFGVKSGVAPVLMMAFILGNMESVAVYENNYLITQFNTAFVDQFFAFPEEITIKWFSKVDKNEQILRNIINALEQVHARFGKDERPLSVARDLVRLVLSEPPLTQSTQELEKKSTLVKAQIKNAYDPVDLLFVQIPKIFPDIENSAESFAFALREIKEFYNKTINSMASKLFSALCLTDNFDGDLTEEQKASLLERTKVVKDNKTTSKLTQFAVKLESATDSIKLCIEGIISSICEKPAKDWNDSCISYARQEMQQLAFEFRRSECYSELQSAKVNKRYLVSVMFNNKQDNLLSMFDIDDSKIAEHRADIEKIEEILKGLDKDVALAILSEVGVRIE